VSGVLHCVRALGVNDVCAAVESHETHGVLVSEERERRGSLHPAGADGGDGGAVEAGEPPPPRRTVRWKPSELLLSLEFYYIVGTCCGVVLSCPHMFVWLYDLDRHPVLWCVSGDVVFAGVGGQCVDQSRRCGGRAEHCCVAGHTVQRGRSVRAKQSRHNHA
jgi:hypothetical protein